MVFAVFRLNLCKTAWRGDVEKNWHSDIDLEHRVLHLERGVKEVWRRDGLQAEPGRDVKVGKLKSATSKRTIPLNDTAIAMIQEDGTIKSLTPRQVADLLGHSTSQITELYYVKKDTSRLHGITDGFNL